MSIDAEWSKGRVSAIGPYTLLLEAYVGINLLGPGGAHRGKRRIVGWEGRVE
jgi:hypothetical protein